MNTSRPVADPAAMDCQLETQGNPAQILHHQNLQSMRPVSHFHLGLSNTNNPDILQPHILTYLCQERFRL